MENQKYREDNEVINEEIRTEINKAINDFGGLLREYRLEHNLSLQDMSEMIGFSASYIWRIERYKRFPEMETKLKILLEMWDTEDIYRYLSEIIIRERNAI